MKKILFYSLLLLSFPSFCQQQGSLILNWVDNAEIAFPTHKVKVPQFQAENFQYNGNIKEIFFTMRLPVNSHVDAGSLQISTLIYESIPASSLGQLNINAIPASINARIENITARDKQFAQIFISPIIKDGTGYKRIKSFTYNITPSSARITNSYNSVNAITNSVLASGDWYRFYVEKSGVYKISKSFLQSLGLNVSGDPRKIKIFGNGGRMLPLLNSTQYPNDITENAIQLIGESDGSFDSADHILFYAEGVDNFNAESYTHNNLYSNRSYYYVTTGGADGKRIAPMDPLTNDPQPITQITTFDDYQYYEKDLINVVRLGRQWFGEQFNIDNEQEFEFNFPNLVAGAPMMLNVVAASASFAQTSMAIQANNQPAGTITFNALTANASFEADTGELPEGSAQFSLGTNIQAAENVTIKITYNNNGVPGSRGFLDFITIRAKRNLAGLGKQFRFQFNNGATMTGIGEYQISNTSSISQVWDITDIFNVTASANAASASNFSFKSYLGELRKFIAVDPSDYFSPQKESNARVANQDLKGTIFNNAQGQFDNIDYLIITPTILFNKAEELANFHRSYSQLNVKVVKLDLIYQEFGSGKQDIAAIRNFVKYVYDNASPPNEHVKYLNLFGDGSFDFKDRIPDNTNLVPTYHSLLSTSTGEYSFVSDDFFALMDSNEGLIDRYVNYPNIAYNFGGADIAVGRMIVNDPAQADEMVTKVIDYHDYKSYGSWRNNIVMIADDADVPTDWTLQTKQNQLADMISSQKPFFNLKKILLDSYEQESSAGGERYPKARQELFNSFEKGALVFNYLGHGGEDGLSTERIWEKVDGQTLQNRYRYPLFITITCEFSRFDNPYRPTAGEYTYWNPLGGAIGMITTVRSIGQGSAETFNNLLSQYLLFYNAGEGMKTSIAESLRLAKSASGNSAANVVVYLGDPAVFLAIPEPKIRLTEVNDAPVTGPIDDLQSLAFVKLEGEITDENNVPITNYNGELAVNIFDKIIARETLDNDGNADPITFNVLGETIFRGNASVTNGKFEFGFVVPRDIRIPVGNGRISFYAKRNQILLDKTGYDNTIKIGGINENAVADNIGPRVKLYMNDQTFVSGGITNENPIFLAFLEDEHGINTASGIGHDIVAILDGDESNPYILNDYYETELDDYTKGKLRFPLRDLEKGLHTITFKAWDVYNNPITAEIQFVVVGDESITLTNVLNYPNPFVSYTQFWFTHNRPFEPLEVQVQVITVTGKVVWTRNQIVTTDGFLSREITWDGRDDFGDRIGKGVYIYKLTVKSSVTNSKTEKYEKLVIL